MDEAMRNADAAHDIRSTSRCVKEELVGSDAMPAAAPQRAQNTASSSSSGSELEVIAAIRPFREANWDTIGLYRRCSPGMKRKMLYLGICHYVTAFRDTKTGEVTLFDFGPEGADVVMGLGPLRKKGAHGSGRSGVFDGEIREMTLPPGEGLPEEHIVVGRTRMTLNEIRAFNRDSFDKQYKMSTNDCRHYMNAVCSHCVGEAKNVNWALRLVKNTYTADRVSRQVSPSPPLVNAALMPVRGLQDAGVAVGQHFFEATNFRNISCVSRTLFATVMALSGVRTFRAPVPPVALLPASRFAPLAVRAPKVVKASSLLATAGCVSEAPMTFAGEALRLGSKIGEGVRVGVARFSQVLGGIGRGFVRGVGGTTLIGAKAPARKMTKSARQVASSARRVAFMSTSAVRVVCASSATTLGAGVSGIAWNCRQKLTMKRGSGRGSRRTGNNAPGQLSCS